MLELLDGSARPVGQRYAMLLDLAQRVITPTLRHRNHCFDGSDGFEVFTEGLGHDRIPGQASGFEHAIDLRDSVWSPSGPVFHEVLIPLECRCGHEARSQAPPTQDLPREIDKVANPDFFENVRRLQAQAYPFLEFF